MKVSISGIINENVWLAIQNVSMNERLCFAILCSGSVNGENFEAEYIHYSTWNTERLFSFPFHVRGLYRDIVLRNQKYAFEVWFLIFISVARSDLFVTSLEVSLEKLIFQVVEIEKNWYVSVLLSKHGIWKLLSTLLDFSSFLFRYWGSGIRPKNGIVTFIILGRSWTLASVSIILEVSSSPIFSVTFPSASNIFSPRMRRYRLSKCIAGFKSCSFRNWNYWRTL